MRLSKFSIKVDVDKNTKLLYSTFSRNYFIYGKNEAGKLEGLLSNINKENYSLEEIDIIKELVTKKILVTDETDELKELEFHENMMKYQSDTFHIMIVVTNACNFRCTYCIQEHVTQVLNDKNEEKIILLLRQMSKRFRKIKIAWFGGEPLLGYDRIKNITKSTMEECEKNNCMLQSSMATNGYLLDMKVIKELKKLNFTNIQITLDGDKETHNSRRFMVSGQETYDMIVKNLVMTVKEGIPVILRINMDKDSYLSACNVLQEIPVYYREKIAVQISNMYQTKDKISTYDMYKNAIELGYQYSGRKNIYMACQACLKNGIIVDADGKLIICTNADERDKILGYISDSGSINIQYSSNYYKLKTASALENIQCRSCVELPYCVGTCKYHRMLENQECIGHKNDGLSVEERAKLDYVYDEHIRKIKKGGRLEYGYSTRK